MPYDSGLQTRGCAISVRSLNFRKDLHLNLKVKNIAYLMKQTEKKGWKIKLENLCLAPFALVSL
jgi:hypothetical protein